MINIAILYNPTTYPYHSNILTIIEPYFSNKKISYQTIDVEDNQVLKTLSLQDYNILLTFDLAGFSYRTQLGEISLNNLFTKNLNLIWGNKPEYTKYLSKKLSLSMHFYDVTGIDHKLRNQYPNIEYYNANYTLEDINDFSNLWGNFINEVLLTE